MGTSTIARAARAEKMAEGDRKAAETAWRKAWWKTTLELAKPDDSAKKEIGEAYDEAEAILGQRRDYLSSRRQTGRAFVVLAHDEIETLQPRKAIAVKDAGIPVTTEVIEMLRESEREEESLREFSARLTGTSWSVGSDEEIEKALEAKPELAAKVAAKTLRTEEGRKTVAVEMSGSDEDTAALRRASHEADVTRHVKSGDASTAERKRKEKAAEKAAEEAAAATSGAVAPSAGMLLINGRAQVVEFFAIADGVDYRFDPVLPPLMREVGESLKGLGQNLIDAADGKVTKPSDEEMDKDLEALLSSGS